MRWLEEIRVRTQPQKQREVVGLLLETAASVRRNRQLKSASVYSHHSAYGGFGLVLTWHTASLPEHGRETGMLTLEGLKALWLLDRTVPIEKEERKTKHLPLRPGFCERRAETKSIEEGAQ